MNSAMRLLALALAVTLAAASASAQSDWPDKPIRVVVPFPAGSYADITTRILQQKLGPRLGQQLVIDNRSGASGNIGADNLATSRAAGYIAGAATTSPHAVAAALTPTLPSDPPKVFALVSLIGAAPYVLIPSPELPPTSIKDLIALAKAKPDAINYATAGPASL